MMNKPFTWKETNKEEILNEIHDIITKNKFKFKGDVLAPLKIFNVISDFFNFLITDLDPNGFPELTTRGMELVDIIWKEIMKEFPEWEYKPTEEELEEARKEYHDNGGTNNKQFNE